MLEYKGLARPASLFLGLLSVRMVTKCIFNLLMYGSCLTLIDLKIKAHIEVRY